MFRKTITLILLISSLLGCKIVFAYILKSGFKEFGVSLGFLKENLEDKEDLKETPFLLRFGFDLRPWLKVKNNNILKLVLEPYSSWIMEPKSNFRTGCNFILNTSIRFNRLYPYFEAGVGFSYFTLQTREQSTQFNFVETVGAGISYFLKENLSISLGYRYQHLSNASIKRPNKGIDSGSFVLGISLYY